MSQGFLIGTPRVEGATERRPYIQPCKSNAGKAQLPKEALHPVIGPIPIPGWPLHGNMAARLYNSTSNLDKTTPNLPKIGNVGFNLGDGVRTPRPIDPLVPIAFTNARKGTEHKDGDSSEKTSG